MRSVAIVLFPHVQSLDVAGPLDVFAEANGFVAAEDGYQITTIGAAPYPILASNGMPLGAEYTLETAPTQFDILLLPGGPRLPEGIEMPNITAWLKEATPLAGRYGSICTGAFILGHAGLLDGKQVATHWSHAQQLADLFPQARVEADRIYVRDGTLMTSAGVTAGIDMALALVSEDHGPAIALAVAKRSLRSRSVRADNRSSALISRHRWMTTHRWRRSSAMSWSTLPSHFRWSVWPRSWR